ncbi:DUF1294 domain-containing protein [Bremerella cremea]|uniref:DUF1294 domain-containing protein n=1 Tax=Bremerella cremea TaxID=1031537 RepID=A0A368KX56_9BACT|nr:cold shock and DUF1294 domain-containing protein [Bremerella cremea]RCS55920.1 DUF1294 domain-containing protein [Bremerella cremea]
MRLQGKITYWNDDRGFGFITWDEVEDAVFVHIKAFTASGRRPEVGEIVSFEVTDGKEGKPEAKSVRFFDQPRPARQFTGRQTQQNSTFPLLFVLFFISFLAASAYFQRISWLVVVVYGVLSLITLIVYGRDKIFAQQGKWRTPESTLLFLGLIGGWPGGLAAQYLFWHKSSKVEFLVSFWFTVTLNVCAICYLIWIGDAGIVDQWIEQVWQKALAYKQTWPDMDTMLSNLKRTANKW